MSVRPVPVLLLVQLIAVQVHAGDGARRVALFLVDGDSALQARLDAELRAQGFEPVEVSLPATGDDPFGALRDAMRATQAERALRIEGSPLGIRLWIANAATGKQIYREAPSAPERADAAIVALWAVEALRASAVAAEPRAPVATVATRAPPPSAATRIDEPSFALQLAALALLSPGGLHPSAQLMAGGRWLAARPLGVELLVVLPIVSTHIERASGSAAVWIGMLAAGPFIQLGSASARWSGQLAAGAALTLVHASGRANAEYLGQSQHIIGAGPYARAGVALRVWRALRVRADAMVSLVFPQPVLYFGEARSADWGRPSCAVALGVEALF